MKQIMKNLMQWMFAAILVCGFVGNTNKLPSVSRA